MARSEARLSVDIWSDEDFLGLSSDAQRMFMFLISQPDLAHDGVIALRERRWTRAASSLTTEAVRAALCELEEHRFVVIDEFAEELLVRSFIRRDKVYKQPNVLRAAADHLALVTSPCLRRAIAVELERISLEPMPEGSMAILSEMRAALPNPSLNPSPNPAPGTPGDGDPSSKASGAAELQRRDGRRVRAVPAGTEEELAGDDPPGNPSRNPSANPSGKAAPGTPGERGVVTVVSNGFPVPRSSNSPDPDPLPLASLAVVAKRPATRTRSDAEFDRFWSAYPRREAKGAARKAWDRAILRADPDRILTAAGRYRDAPGRDPKFTAHAATWLNADRWEDEPTTTAVAIRDGPRSTADARFNDAMDLAQRYREMDGS